MTPLGIPTRKFSFCLSLSALVAFLFAAPTFARAQGLAFAPVIYGVSSVNGAGSATIMKTPSAIATDVFGNVYIADTFADIVRKVDPTGTAKIFAGSGNYGNTGDNGPAVAAAMTPPTALATDLAGNLYISDSQNFSVRKVDKAGIISTYAGGHGSGSTGDGGAATAAQVVPGALATDSIGNLYILDAGCDCVRIVDTAGTISTYAGGGSVVDSDGGQATLALFSNPEGLAVDALGNLYIADAGSSRVRMVNTLGIISTFAGSTPGNFGDGGPATSARLNAPNAVAVDSSDNVYISDGGNAEVRVVNPSGTISTVGGYLTESTTPFDDGLPANRVNMGTPRGIAADGNGNLYIVVPEMDRAYQVVLHPERFPQTLVGATSPIQRLALVNSRQTDLTVNSVTFSGDFHLAANPSPSPQQCYANIDLQASQNGWCTIDAVFTPTAEGVRSFPLTVSDDGGLGLLTQTLTSSGLAGALAMNTGQLFVIGGDNALTNGNRGEGGPATSAQIETLYGLTVDSAGDVYFSESGNCQIRRIDGQTGILTTIAGIDPQKCDAEDITGDGGPATQAVVPGPEDLALDAHNNLYFADGEDSRIRMIDTAGYIHAVAGLGESIFFSGACQHTGDGGLASQAYLCGPGNLTFDKNGNLFFTESIHQIVRKIDTAGILTTVAGNYALGAGFSGDGGPATSAQLNQPQGLAVDTLGNLFIADTRNDVIRKVDAITGKISTIAGTPRIGGLSGDGGLASKATMNWPMGLSIDAAGDLFFADRNNSVVRKIDTAGYITTVAGNRNIGQGYNGDRLEATATTLSFPNNTFVAASGYLYIADTANEVIRELTPNGMLNFASQQVGTTSGPQSVTLSNVGNMPLHFDSQFPTGISGDFALASGGTCNFTAALAVGASCTASLSFSPITAGPRYGIFAFYDDGVASPQYVALSGTGTAQQPQVITFGGISEHAYGDRSFNLPAVATSGLPVTFTVQSGHASLTGSLLTITGAGPIVVVANQPGNASWLPAPPVMQSFNVRAATLDVTAQNKSSEAGVALQPLTYTITGFVNGDQPSVVSGAPMLTTTATSVSPNSFAISVAIGTLSAANYTFNLVPGTYSVTVPPRVPDGVVTLVTAATITKTDGLYHVTVRVTNNGTATAQNVVLTSAKLNSIAGSPAPQSLGNIPAGGFAAATVSVGATAGASGAAAVEQITGSYTGGTFGGSFRVTLP